jgi:hypothetical protein
MVICADKYAGNTIQEINTMIFFIVKYIILR